VGAAGRSANRMPAIVSSALEAANDGLAIEPGEWRVTVEGAINGARRMSSSEDRCITPDMIRETMTTGQGFLGSNCAMDVERHGDELSGSAQCGRVQSNVRLIFESKVHFVGDLTIAVSGHNGSLGLAQHFEGSRKGAC